MALNAFKNHRSGRLTMQFAVALNLLILTGLPALPDENTRPIIVESVTTALIRHAEIAARDTGMLLSVSVKAGDQVEQGFLLATLEDELQELAVRQCELNVRIAELKAQNHLPVESAQAQVREAEQEKKKLEIAARISQQQADSDIAVRLAEKNREVAHFELDRATKAKEAFSASISKSELNRLQVLFDQRTLEIEQAQEERAIATLKPQGDAAAVLQQEETVVRSRLLISEREQEKQVAETSLDVARNELALARLKLQRRRVYAPFAATVVAVNRQEGEWVEPGTAVLRLIQIDRLRVEGFIGAEIATTIQSGQPVTILFPGAPPSSVPGVVSFVSPEIEPVNQQVRIWAEFENPGQKIRPGLVGSMEIRDHSLPVDK